MKINWNFLKLRWMPKEHLRQLFWRSTDLTFLQIIIVASRPTLPFSWGGGRRFVTGRRQIKDRCRETMDLHQALQTSDKSTTTASYAFNHIPKTLQFFKVLSSWTFSPQFLVIAFHIQSTAQCTVISSWATRRYYKALFINCTTFRHAHSTALQHSTSIRHRMISILNEASSNAPSSMEGVAWTEIYSTYLSDSVPNSIDSEYFQSIYSSHARTEKRSMSKASIQVNARSISYDLCLWGE